jgi:CBS domain-containing protein
MKVEELMTTDVRAVAPELSLKDAAALLAENRIGGMPVLNDSGTPVGVISKADIVIKERGQLPRRSWWRVFGGNDDDATAAKVNAQTVGEAMSSPAITIAPDSSVSIAADRMVECGVNRLPVVQRDRLVGILTRHDLVRVFARDDAEIEQDIRADAFEGLTWPDAIQIDVRGGEVTMRGQADTLADAKLLPVQVRHVLGVVSVDSELSAWDHAAEKLVKISSRI